MAVTVEDLDSGGIVNNIKVVLGIDGGRTRSDKIAVLDAALAPYQFRFGLWPATTSGKEKKDEPR
jgi:hypothetical protein